MSRPVGVLRSSTKGRAWGSMFRGTWMPFWRSWPLMYWFTRRGDSPMGQANISHTPQSQQLAASPKAAR